MQTTGQQLLNPFDYFDAIFLINLDEREDRLKESLEEFNKYNLKLRIYRFPAIKFNTPHPMTGRAGCLLSHRSIIQFAKDRDLNNVLILEDDFHFLHNPIDILRNCVDFLSNNQWDLFYLGQTTTSELVEKPLVKTQNANVLRLFGGLTTHSIAYNKSFFDKFLSSIPNDNVINWLMQNESIDGWLMRNVQVVDTFRCYTTNPMLCIQRPSFSDVDGKFVDYSENLKIAFNNELNKA